MRQFLHLLILDADRGAAVAARLGSRWLLPVVACGERVRAAAVVARWCEQRGIAVDVAGQWLGRVGADAADWLMVAIVSPGSHHSSSLLEWIPLDALTADRGLLDYQEWATGVAMSGGGVPRVNGPFGSPAWPQAVRAWIEDVTGAAIGRWTTYRTSAYEVVASADTAAARVYFKGLEGERAAEAFVTQALARLAPESFARTLAIERRDGGAVWWLMDACPGRSQGNPAVIAAALARLQQRTVDAGLPLGRLDLGAAAHWAIESVNGAEHIAVIRDACERAAFAQVPSAWIPMDLDPGNVLVDEREAVRFIDVDDAFMGPAPLAPALFARRCRGAAVHVSYQNAWPRIGSIDWTSFEIAAGVIDAWLGWQRVVRNIERGEVCDPLNLIVSRVRDGLARVIADRLRCPPPPDDP